MRLGFKVVGVEEAAGALNELGEELGGQRLVDATLAGAQILQNAWKVMAPWKTGQYRRSIHREVRHQSPGRVQVTVGTDIVDPPYPYFLEFGTSKMPPHPSARPAFDETKDEVAREIEGALSDLVDLIWR